MKKYFFGGLVAAIAFSLFAYGDKPSRFSDMIVGSTFQSSGAATFNSTVDVQSTVYVGTGTIDPTALVQMDATSYGLLPPRLTTTQRDAISSPAEGLVVHNTSTNQFNYYNGSSWIAVQSSSSTTSPFSLINLGLSYTVDTNSMDIDITTADGSTPSGGGSVQIPFRSSTLDNGGYNVRSVTSNNDLTIPVGATLGLEDGVEGWIYFYGIDNAGAIEVAVSGDPSLDETSLHSTIAIDADADDGYSLFSATARTYVPIRLLGRGRTTLTTAGEWGDGLDQIDTTYVKNRPRSMVRLHTGNNQGSTNTAIERYTTVVDNIGNAITYTDSAVEGASFLINDFGVYAISMCDAAAAEYKTGVSLNSNQLTTSIQSITTGDILFVINNNTGERHQCGAWIGVLHVENVVRPHVEAGRGESGVPSRCSFTITKVSD